MSKQATYASLESEMLRYVDLVDVPVTPNKEALVPIEASDNLEAKPINDDMELYTGNRVFVRKGVRARLNQAAQLLAKVDPELSLQVVYGYRALSVQQRLFDQYKEPLTSKYSGIDLLEATHRLIAVPEVAGHPTGGAVDIQIVKNGVPLDTGAAIWEFSKDSFTFSPFVSAEALQNRLLLRSVMTRVGFAPFDGEWWHFSYGDREWAKLVGAGAAIYEQIEFMSKHRIVRV